MESFFLTAEFFGGLILLMGVGYLIGHLLDLNNHLEDHKKENHITVKPMILLAAAPAAPGAVVSNGPVSYLIGGIVALLIMGYLVYTLLRPDKF